jgi:hypothetical protein
MSASPRTDSIGAELKLQIGFIISVAGIIREVLALSKQNRVRRCILKFALDRSDVHTQPMQN